MPVNTTLSLLQELKQPAEFLETLSHPLFLDILTIICLEEGSPIQLSRVYQFLLASFTSIQSEDLLVSDEVKLALDLEALSLVEQLSKSGFVIISDSENGEKDQAHITQKGIDLVAKYSTDSNTRNAILTLREAWGRETWIRVVRSAERLTSVIDILGKAEGHSISRSELQPLMNGESNMEGHTKRILRSFPLYLVSSEDLVELTTLGVWVAKGSIPKSEPPHIRAVK